MKWELVIIMVMMAGMAEAVLQCSVTESCTDTVVYRMSDTANAHASLANETDYTYAVCCKEVGGDVLSLTGTPFMHLSSNHNAHAESINETDYEVNISISATSGTINCSNSSSACAQGCLGTISAATNAHVADCITDPYSTYICCDYTSTAAPLEPGSGGGASSLGDKPEQKDTQNVTLSQCQYKFTKKAYIVGEPMYFVFNCTNYEGLKYLATWQTLDGEVMHQEMGRLQPETVVSYTATEPTDGKIVFQVVNVDFYELPFRVLTQAQAVMSYVMLGAFLVGGVTLGVALKKSAHRANKRLQAAKKAIDEKEEP